MSVAQRLRVVATYEAAAGRDLKILYGGLCNQIYTHVGMLAVLLQLGAEVVRAREHELCVFRCQSTRAAIPAVGESYVRLRCLVCWYGAHQHGLACRGSSVLQR